MKKRNIGMLLLGVAMLFSQTSCKKWLNVNSDPDTPQAPSPSSVIPWVEQAASYGIQRDARYIAKFAQHWLASSAGDTYDAHGYTWGDNNMGDLWWAVYFTMGNNMNYIIQYGEKNNQHDWIGVGKALKAWGFQSLTDEHDYAPLKEAWDENIVFYKFDSAATIYQGVEALCRESIQALDSAISNPAFSSGQVGSGDMIYAGDLTKWKKFVYGILARNYNHQSNKANYNADSVIKYCNLSMQTVADDYMLPFDATVNDNSNFYGTFRNNLGAARQSNFIVQLLDGTIFSGNTLPASRDPRMKHMLACSQDTTNGNGGFRGVNPGSGDPYVSLTGTYTVGSTNWVNARKRVAVLWGDSIYANPSSAVFGNSPGKYLFSNKAVMPVMTSSEIAFILAEAYYRKGLKFEAWTAYKKGIGLHFDMINRSYAGLRGNSNLYNGSPIPDAQKNAYLAGTSVKQDPMQMHLEDILLQKFISMWGWGTLESWVDLRRFKYTNIDPETGQQYYRGFSLPATFYANNQGKPALRVRANYRSEGTYNFDQLQQTGQNQLNWHTLDFWPSRP